jgi:peptide/histidine transporter 3/4
LIGCWKHQWFYSEPGHQNPYKVVLRVFNFARKHKYPLQRSAFTYCDDERPTRLDFAKERFGGPFTTEQVEDVKIFLRILIILIVIGPVLVLDVPTSPIFMFFFGVHFGSSEYCSWSWIIVSSGLLRHITSVLFLPAYICVLFSRLCRNHTPSIFCRLGCGIGLYILGALSIFFVEIAGHVQYQENDMYCINRITSNGTAGYLNLHWAAYIPSNLLIGIGPTLLTVTVFEFISAQSPHTMKGLLLGTYFAISGMYQFIASVVLVPFASHNFWTNKHPSRAGCLFGYFLFLCLIAVFGMILFIVAARRYKYRQREDRPYDHRFVIDFYARYLNEAHKYESSSDSDSDSDS